MDKVISQGKRVYSGGKKWKPGSSAKGLEAAIGKKAAGKITDNPPAQSRPTNTPPPVTRQEGEPQNIDKKTEA